MQLEHVPRKRTQDQEEGQGQIKLNRGVEQVLQELVGENGNVEEFANNLRVLLAGKDCFINQGSNTPLNVPVCA